MLLLLSKLYLLTVLLSSQVYSKTILLYSKVYIKTNLLYSKGNYIKILYQSKAYFHLPENLILSRVYNKLFKVSVSIAGINYFKPPGPTTRQQGCLAVSNFFWPSCPISSRIICLAYLSVSSLFRSILLWCHSFNIFICFGKLVKMIVVRIYFR